MDLSRNRLMSHRLRKCYCRILHLWRKARDESVQKARQNHTKCKEYPLLGVIAAARLGFVERIRFSHAIALIFTDKCYNLGLRTLDDLFFGTKKKEHEVSQFVGHTSCGEDADGDSMADTFVDMISCIPISLPVSSLGPVMSSCLA